MSIKDMLRENVLVVTFTKSDGTERVMLCTTKEELIEAKTYSSNSGPEHICTVWDLEAKGWRSFKIDSILSVEVLEWEV